MSADSVTRLKPLRLAFVVGAGRSGTTWLQEILGAHPEIATGQESHLFPAYLNYLWRQWEKEVGPERGDLRRVGIANYVTQQEYLDILRTFAESILLKIASLKPMATMVVEKTPRHCQYMELLGRCFPEAKVIHVIRDGRAVAASMLTAARGWGRNWAPRTARRAAKDWLSCVSDARRARDRVGDYLEVRYEGLHDDAVAQVTRVLEFLGVQASPETVQTLVERASFEALKTGKAESSILRCGELAARAAKTGEPVGFYNKGTADSWRQSLTRRQLRTIHRVAGALLAELGYVTPEELRESLSITDMICQVATKGMRSIFRPQHGMPSR
ncbi:MAG: sulfotransferase [Pirellulales bacterium]|nr:sulfotransferase [Pirellulales bacterium]